MLVNNFMHNLGTNLQKVDKLQTQLAKNSKFAHISDDPIGVLYGRSARYNLHLLEHYNSNLDYGKTWLTKAEDGLTTLNETLVDAYNACIDSATDAKTSEDRKATAQLIGQLREHLLDALNGAVGDRFVYGAYNTTGNVAAGDDAVVPPFTVGEDGHLKFNGIDLVTASSAAKEALMEDVISFEMGPGIDMEITLNGVEVVLFDKDGNNIYNLLDDFYNVMSDDNSTAEDVAEFVKPLQDAQEHILALTSQTGGRMNRIEMLTARYEQDYINYTQMKSDAEDADEAELIMMYEMARVVYEASLKTGASIMQMSLLDFLQ
jgi:flagellar hook-associated protein 3 FlgL